VSQVLSSARKCGKCLGMPRTGRPRAVLSLSDEERDELVRLARRPKSAQALALRARLVLACAEGGSNEEVAADLGVSVARSGSGGSS
jgi:hypothetical protein